MYSYAMIDCDSVKNYGGNGYAKKSANFNPDCANGWTYPYGQNGHGAQQLSSMNQYAQVPLGCPESINVFGASFVSAKAMGVYKLVRASPTIGVRALYKNDADMYMFYSLHAGVNKSKSKAAWVLGVPRDSVPWETLLNHTEPNISGFETEGIQLQNDESDLPSAWYL